MEYNHFIGPINDDVPDQDICFELETQPPADIEARFAAAATAGAERAWVEGAVADSTSSQRADRARAQDI